VAGAAQVTEPGRKKADDKAIREVPYSKLADNPDESKRLSTQPPNPRIRRARHRGPIQHSLRMWGERYCLDGA